MGLAISLLAGEAASLLLSRMTVPTLYYLSERRKYEKKAGSKRELKGLLLKPVTEADETRVGGRSAGISFDVGVGVIDS